MQVARAPCAVAFDSSVILLST